MEPLYAAHVVAFSLAAVVCVWVLVRTAPIADADTERGLWLFVLSSAGWAAANVGYLVAPGAALKYGFHVLGLLVGFWTVFAWLYFCSAYAGRSFHRTPAVRRSALGLYLAVALVKVTNPLHGLYFEASMADAPFHHLAVDHGLLHWLVLGLSYALSLIGIYLLLELFAQVGRRVRPVVVVSALFAGPLALDVVGVATGLLPEMNYEPLGVAAFAVGVAVVYETEFRTVQVAAERDDPVVVLTDDGRIRDYNRRATEVLPSLGTDCATGAHLADVAPAIAAGIEAETDVVAIDEDNRTRYYQVTTTRPGTSGLGRVVTLTDVTERESYRQELERQNERLERFASLVSHDLRNPLNVAQGRIELAMEDCGNESLETVSESLDRMETLIDDLLALARQGQDIDERSAVGVADLATTAWRHVEVGEATLDVESDLTVEGDPERLQQLFENLFRNAVEHGSTSSQTQSADAVEHGSTSSQTQSADAVEHGSTSPRSGAPEDAVEHGGPAVTVRVGALSEGRGFYVADDGPGIPEEHREEVFESGFTTSESGTGFGLAIVSEIVRAHGWDVRLAESESGGARFEVVVESA